MSMVARAESAEQHAEIVVASTGEILPALDTEHWTRLQIRQWLYTARDAVPHMTVIDELNQAEAALAAVIKRQRQIDEDTAEAERLRILIFKQIGDLLPEPQRGNPRPETGRSSNSQHEEIENKPRQESQREWQCRRIAGYWDKVESAVEKMKKPSVNAVLREIKRLTSRLEVAPDGGEAIITHARWEDWLPQQPNCDLLLTDPPYATNVDDIDAFAAHWLPFGLGKVKPTGRAYVCIGAYPHELAAYLAVPPPAHLVLSQVLVWIYRNTLGPTPKYDYKLNWQAILYYRGVDAPPLDSPEMLEQFSVADINAPDGRQGDRWHPWQKPDKLADRYIRHATKPGDVILDPFAGTGTHLLAAARLGRRGYGCDLNPDTVEIARQRGCIDAS
jgi:hypothetical protein